MICARPRCSPWCGRWTSSTRTRGPTATFAEQTMEGELKRALRDRSWTVRPACRPGAIPRVAPERGRADASPRAPRPSPASCEALDASVDEVLEAVEAAGALDLHHDRTMTGSRWAWTSLGREEHGFRGRRGAPGRGLARSARRAVRLIELRFFERLGQGGDRRAWVWSQSYLSRLLHARSWSTFARGWSRVTEPPGSYSIVIRSVRPVTSRMRRWRSAPAGPGRRSAPAGLRSRQPGHAGRRNRGTRSARGRSRRWSRPGRRPVRWAGPGAQGRSRDRVLPQARSWSAGPESDDLQQRAARNVFRHERTLALKRPRVGWPICAGPDRLSVDLRSLGGVPIPDQSHSDAASSSTPETPFRRRG